MKITYDTHTDLLYLCSDDRPQPVINTCLSENIVF